MQNPVPPASVPAAAPLDVAERVARETLRRRGVDYADEVRRLLDAAMAVMRAGGTTTRARVGDIVAAAGLSNEAFYRHFRSKDALVAALVEDGAERLASYLAHQMAKEADAARQVRRFVDGVLSQTEPEIAAATRAVLFNSAGTDDARSIGRHPSSALLAPLLHGPLAALGSTQVREDADFVAHAVLGCLTDHLWAATQPSAAERDRLVARCLRVVGVMAPSARRPERRA